MIAQATAKLLAVTGNSFTDKETGKVVDWYKNDLLSKEGVLTISSGKDYHSLTDKEVLLSFDIQGKDRVKLVNIELFDDGKTID